MTARPAVLWLESQHAGLSSAGVGFETSTGDLIIGGKV
jgi:hypothetical protein